MAITTFRLFNKGLSTILLSLLLLPGAQAAGMVPQTPVLIVDQGVGEATMNVRNTDAHPALLYTQIENLSDNDRLLLIPTPTVTRVEGGDVQQVRFLLQSAEPLREERLKRVIFEGINPVADEQGARVSLGVRQNLPVILRPANLPVEREPWKRLRWSIASDGLHVSNPSPYVVRLAKTLVMLPGQLQVDLPRTYLLPGDELTLSLRPADAPAISGVRLFPATTYGFAVEHFDAALVAP
ncbi:fimbria/pilus chaperone family protein [Pseudomonas sp. RA_35y_Pfl2_P32]|uniref:fimbria/pilus chaperone family protein n=1 Tax=Pseudomonas sp. RA_35y_Pfl2_P32 TaxID=3088705 RepID=UPI0030D965B2